MTAMQASVMDNLKQELARLRATLGEQRQVAHQELRALSLAADLAATTLSTTGQLADADVAAGWQLLDHTIRRVRFLEREVAAAERRIEVFASDQD